jgi:CarboxypepD_reg-like domain
LIQNKISNNYFNQNYISMKISIHNPCSESWAEMDDLGSTRFCASCQKCVTDFTQLSDSAIAQILESHDGALCGRFKVDQLDRALLLNDSKQNKYLTALFSMSLASMVGFQNEVQAKPMLPIGVNQVAQDTLKPSQKQSATPQTMSKDSILLGGVVQDVDTGEPLAWGAFIFLEGTKLGTSTDSLGKFEFMVPKDSITQKSKLIISLVGYESQVLPFSTIQPNQPISILLKSKEIFLGGVIEYRYTFKQKVKRFFRKMFH